MQCRHCHANIEQTIIDLGFAPPSNAYMTLEQMQKPQLYFPLRLKVCTECWLVQTEDYARANELFQKDYAYFSSTSSSWVAHAKRYVETMCAQCPLDSRSFVIEVASNDGYLLQHMVDKGIPCIGIEPTHSTAEAARLRGVPTYSEFFGEHLGNMLPKADLVIGNNVYAHVPDINDFTKGLKACLKSCGTITLEFPHLLNLLKEVQFDTIYHEHYSYLSLYTVSRLFQVHGLRVFDVEQLQTHGGSLRIFGCHDEDTRPTQERVQQCLLQEQRYGLQTLAAYQHFQKQAEKIKNDFLTFLLENQHKKIAAYGAAAKGNTLLNFAGIKSDLVHFVCDASTAKQGKFLPGSLIPIRAPEVLLQEKPDFIWIIPWNLRSELQLQLAPVKAWGGRFVTCMPCIDVF